ncbi:Altered inheritance of mitochondria protein 24, mitochondrial [Xylographa opegraphella]|nr:Altered inheritance of mitochondria protein 24, mitochondrial [Xylographa opegraphella]
MRRAFRGAAEAASVPLQPLRCMIQPHGLSWGRRSIQISPTPSGASPSIQDFTSESLAILDTESPDAKFEVLGVPYSLLSATLSASQNLYTRRGTLVGVSGKSENAISTLSILEPFRRVVLGIPFFYQKISSTTPLTALISTKSPITSFTVIHLDGTLDWMIAQRQALLAWTGQTLSISPVVNRQMVPHWGNSQVTGRGLLAVVGKGQIYQIVLKPGEEYVAHPSNVVAYTLTQNPPLPYRLKASVLRLQIPGLSFGSLLPDTKFFRVMRESTSWRALKSFLYTLRTWSRRTIWGDRLFLQFHGPMTILIQSRASRLSDVLTSRDVNEIAETQAGVAQQAVTLTSSKVAREKSGERTLGGLNDPKSTQDTPTGLSVARIGQDGKVRFERTADFSALSR